MTHLANIVLKFLTYNVTKVTLKWTADWADSRHSMYVSERWANPLSSFAVDFPSIPALCVIMMDCSVGFGETGAGPAVLTTLPFPPPALVKYSSLKLMN